MYRAACHWGSTGCSSTTGTSGSPGTSSDTTASQTTYINLSLRRTLLPTDASHLFLILRHSLFYRLLQSLTIVFFFSFSSLSFAQDFLILRPSSILALFYISLFFYCFLLSLPPSRFRFLSFPNVSFFLCFSSLSILWISCATFHDYEFCWPLYIMPALPKPLRTNLRLT